LRLLVYDRTCRGPALLPGLSSVWSAGARLYSALGRLEAHFGAASWQEALSFLAEFRSSEQLSEVQFWGHGKWGELRISGDVLDARALSPRHPHAPLLDKIRDRMQKGAAGLFWFRTCETFGAERGQKFAREFGDFMNCRVAGHTYVIGAWQSGLHVLEAGEMPSWPAEEGLCDGTPKAPIRALPSAPNAPNTITCFDGKIPDGWR